MKRAFTLVEMLIVVSIIVVLAAVSLPIAKKVSEGNRLREASRQLNAVFATARSKALYTGRPCGVEFPCVPPLGDNSVRQVTQIFLAETPAPVCGSTTAAIAKIQEMPAGSGVRYFVPVDRNIPPQIDGAETGFLTSLIDDGAQFLVRFDHKGDWYVCLRNGSQFLYLRPATSSVMPPGYSNPSAIGYPFEILRAPKRVGSAIDLPNGTAIDMAYSGMGQSGQQFALPLNKLTVLLAPGGEVTDIYVDSNAPIKPLGTLHFLVGRAEKVSSLASPSDWSNPAKSNLADTDNVWVSIGPRNGIAMTAENLPLSSSASSGLSAYLKSARQAAQARDQITGR